MADTNATTVTPFLTVRDGKKAVDFYRAAFRAVETERHNRADGTITAKISLEGADFWIGDEEPQFGNLSPDQQAANPVRIILQTRSADELFEQALQVGATAICPMTTEDDWRIGKLKDPFGHIWEIGYTL